MSKHVGRRGTLALAKESSRGTIATANRIWVPRSTISFDDKIESQREQEGLGKIADSDSNFVTQVMGGGEIESMLDDKALGIVLTSLMGASPVITGSSPWTHTYTLSNSNQHTSLSLLYQDPDISKVFPLGVVDSLKMTIEQNAIVMWTIGFKSRVGKDWTAVSADFTSLGSKFLHQHLVFKLASAVGGLAGATAISLKKLELTVSANTKYDTVLGTVEPEDILGQDFSVEGTLELNKEDETYRRFMLDGTYRSMDMTLLRSTSSKFQLQLPRVDFTEWEQDRKLGEIVSQKINFKGNYDAANALDIISTCILINLYAGTGY
jgi:hypothetical protein